MYLGSEYLLMAWTRKMRHGSVFFNRKYAILPTPYLNYFFPFFKFLIKTIETPPCYLKRNNKKGEKYC